MRGFVDGHRLRLKFRTSAEPWRVSSAKGNGFASSSLLGGCECGVTLVDGCWAADKPRPRLVGFIAVYGVVELGGRSNELSRTELKLSETGLRRDQ